MSGEFVVIANSEGIRKTPSILGCGEAAIWAWS